MGVLQLEGRERVREACLKSLGLQPEFIKQQSRFRKRKSTCGRPDTGNPPFEEVKEGHLEWRSVSKRENGVRSIGELHRRQYWETREPCMRGTNPTVSQVVLKEIVRCSGRTERNWAGDKQSYPASWFYMTVQIISLFWALPSPSVKGGDCTFRSLRTLPVLTSNHSVIFFFIK